MRSAQPDAPLGGDRLDALILSGVSEEQQLQMAESSELFLSRAAGVTEYESVMRKALELEDKKLTGLCSNPNLPERLLDELIRHRRILSLLIAAVNPNPRILDLLEARGDCRTHIALNPRISQDRARSYSFSEDVDVRRALAMNNPVWLLIDKDFQARWVFEMLTFWCPERELRRMRFDLDTWAGRSEDPETFKTLSQEFEGSVQELLLAVSELGK